VVSSGRRVARMRTPTPSLNRLLKDFFYNVLRVVADTQHLPGSSVLATSTVRYSKSRLNRIRHGHAEPCGVGRIVWIVGTAGGIFPYAEIGHKRPVY